MLPANDAAILEWLEVALAYVEEQGQVRSVEFLQAVFEDVFLQAVYEDVLSETTLYAD